MDDITQARYNFVLAFQYCWNGKEFPVFREISVCEDEHTHWIRGIQLSEAGFAGLLDFQEKVVWIPVAQTFSLRACGHKLPCFASPHMPRKTVMQ